LKYRPPPVGAVHPSSRPRRRLRCMPWLAGAPPRHPASLDDLPCPVSLCGDLKRRQPPAAWSLVTSLLLAGRETTPSTTPAWFLWEGLRSPPAPTWRISSCACCVHWTRRCAACVRHLHDAIAESIRLFSALAVPACTVTPRAQVRSPPEHVRTPFVFATLSPLWRQRDLLAVWLLLKSEAARPRRRRPAGIRH